MELTDTQLHVLLLYDVWFTHAVPTTNIKEELTQLGLFTYVSGEESLELTNLGKEVLIENRVRALSLLRYTHVMLAARDHFECLSLKELPLLLTHSSKFIRAYARERMEELTYESYTLSGMC